MDKNHEILAQLAEEHDRKVEKVLFPEQFIWFLLNFVLCIVFSFSNFVASFHVTIAFRQTLNEQNVEQTRF